MAKRLSLLSLLLMVSVTFVGCSRNELARIPIQEVGEFETEFAHPGGELDLWTDLDIEYTGTASASYTIEIFRDEEKIETVTCDPFLIEESLMERYVDANGLQKISFLALMDCLAFLPEGNYSARINFTAIGNDLTIFRADLIFKQPIN